MLRQAVDGLLSHRWVVAVVVAAISALLASHLVPLKYDFSFPTLFIEQGEDFDRLRDYLARFGADENVLVVLVESDELYSRPVFEQIDGLTRELEGLAGVEEVESPSTAERLVGDGVEVRRERIVPRPFPEREQEWRVVRQGATRHPLHGGTLFAENGRFAAIFVNFGVEVTPRSCDNGLDDDANSLVDCDDPFCSRQVGLCQATRSERSNSACTNGIDDDGDHHLDCADTDCLGLMACSWVASAESSQQACRDGLDNDADGLVDCADDDCPRNPLVRSCSTTRVIMRLIEEREKAVAAAGIDLRFHLGGFPYVAEAYAAVLAQALKTFVTVAFSMIALTLFLLFRSGLGVILPGLVIGLTMVWGFGFMQATGGTFNMVNSALPILLLVIAAADSIHIIARYLDEAGRATSRREAIQRSMRPMILACALTSLTTAVGFGSLVTAHFPVVRQYGMYAAAGVLFAYVLSMSLVPVGLSMVRLPVGATAEAATRGGRLTDRLIGVAVALVTRRRRLAWVGTALVTLVAGFGVLLVDEDLRVTAELDPTHPASVSNRLIEETVGGALSGAVVLTSGPGAFADPGLLRVLDEISAYAESWRTEEGERLVSRTLSVTGFIKEAFSAYTGDPADYRIPDTRAAVLTLLDQVPRDRLRRVLSNDYGVAQLRFQMSDLGSAAWRELRAQIAPLLERRLADTGDVAFTFTGFFTYSQDVAAWMTRDLVTSLFLATGVIAILIIGLFRSIRIGLLSMVPNLFALLVLGGIIGYAGIELRPSTAIVFSICIGIAVDDTIHVLARFREELGRHEDYEDALIRAMYGTGRAVLFTTLLLLLGFGTMMFSDFTATRELGLLGGITVSAALIGDLFLLPLLLLSLRKRWTARVRQGGAAAKSGVRASAAGRGEGLP